MPLTEDKVKAYGVDKVKVFELLGNLIIKFLLTIVAIIAFFIILNYILHQDKWENQSVMVFFEGILAATFYKLYKHYFN